MPHKILVVDDDPVDIRLIQAVLSLEGYQVITAVNGVDALEKVRQEKPDLIVLDVMMPEINGYDVCYELRFNDEFKKIPIIILTLREQEIDEEIGKRLCIEYVAKPVDPKVLIQKMQHLLSAQ